MSSILNGLIIRIPPRAELHPENCDIMTFDLSNFFSAFLTEMNSNGGMHYPSLREVIRRMFDIDHKARRSILLRFLKTKRSAPG